MNAENKGNIFHNLPNDTIPEELFEVLLEGKGVKLERIISTGQITPEDQWYDSHQDEWVMLIKGNARLLFEDEKEVHLQLGDYLFIPAHKKHRVSWTDPDEVSVWLAFHVDKAVEVFSPESTSQR